MSGLGCPQRSTRFRAEKLRPVEQGGAGAGASLRLPSLPAPCPVPADALQPSHCPVSGSSCPDPCPWCWQTRASCVGWTQGEWPSERVGRAVRSWLHLREGSICLPAFAVPPEGLRAGSVFGKGPPGKEERRQRSGGHCSELIPGDPGQRARSPSILPWGCGHHGHLGPHRCGHEFPVPQFARQSTAGTTAGAQAAWDPARFFLRSVLVGSPSWGPGTVPLAASCAWQGPSPQHLSGSSREPEGAGLQEELAGAPLGTSPALSLQFSALRGQRHPLLAPPWRLQSRAGN